MWDCEECGCKQIAGTIKVCPMCQAARPEPEPAADASDDKKSQSQTSKGRGRNAKGND